MTLDGEQLRTGGAMALLGHELGRLLAAYGSEAERVALAALEVVREAEVDEATFRSAKLRIEGHLSRIRRQRHVLGTLMTTSLGD